MFKKAVKKQLKLRLALMGTSGSGKTYTALNVAQYLGGKVAVIDTEHSSASKYADLFDFDACDLESFNPLKYVEAINEAASLGYEVIIIDSLSHAWMGKDGLLEQVDRISKRSYNGNSFGAWKDANPLLVKLTEAILACPAHVIATFRTKSEWVIEQNERGKNVPKKIGMAPIFKDSVEYEFDVVGELNQENELIVSKTRCPHLTGQVIAKPGKDLAQILSGWLDSGETASHQPEKADADALMSETSALIKQLGWSGEQGKQHLSETYGKQSRQKLTTEELKDFLAYLKKCAEEGLDVVEDDPQEASELR